MRASFPQSRVELDKLLLSVWFEALKDLDDKAFAEGIKEILQVSKFFPSIAEIREVAAKHKSICEALPEPKLTQEQIENNRSRMAELIDGLGREVMI